MMQLFTPSTKALVGMVHVQALPGSPNSELEMDKIIQAAVEDAEVIRSGGFDGIIVENMHDRPYVKSPVPPETVAAMAVVAKAVKEFTGLPVGIQILAGANKEAMAVAVAAGLNFVRAEGYVFAHVADEGIIESDAGDLLRYRRQIGGDEVAIYADIKKKHSSHSITDDLDILDVAKAAEFFMADGIIVTGDRTGIAPSDEDLEAVADMELPVIVGSGVSIENAAQLMRQSNGLIVGSELKELGHWENSVERARVDEMIEAVWGSPEEEE